MPPKKQTKITYLEFPFTQKERDIILRHCVLKKDVEIRFRKIAPVGQDIIVVFDKSEANEMMNSLLQAASSVSNDEELKEKFNDLHERFREKYNTIFRN